MAEHHYVERVENRNGNYGVIIAATLVLMIVMAVVFFTILGRAPGANVGAPGQTNVNVPAQQQQPSQPNVQVPRQIDVNINAPAMQAPAQAPAQPPANGQSSGSGR
jgi:hypothetical protein